MSGEGRMLCFEGPPGIGKSKLLSWAVDRAAAKGHFTFTARASSLRSKHPYGCAIQLFETYLSHLPEADLKQTFAGSARLAGDLFEPGNGAPLEQGLSRIHGLFWLLSNVTDRGPVLIALDDVHWADIPTLRFILYLAHRIAQMPVTLLLSYRAGEQGEHHELISQIAGHEQLRRIQLRGLSESAVAQLVRTRIPEASDVSCGEIAEITEGNPLFVRELASAALDAEMDLSGDPPSELPDLLKGGLQRTVTERLRSLSPVSIAVAEALAILGSDADRDLLVRLSDTDDATLTQALADLRAAEIVRSEGLVFSHPLVASVIYEGIPVDERTALHSQAAQLLHSTGGTDETIAPHILMSSGPEQQWEIETLLSAAKRALARGAPESAASFLRRALAAVQDGHDKARLLLELAEAEARSDHTTALERLKEATDLLEDHGELARAYHRTGLVLFGAGRPGAAVEAFDSALQHVPESEVELTQDIKADLIVAGRLHVDSRPRALALLEELRSQHDGSSTRVSRKLSGELGIQAVREGVDRERALALLRDAASQLDLDGDDPPNGLLPTVLLGLTWADDLKTVAQISKALLEDARRRGSVMSYATARAFGAGATYRAGNIPAAAAAAEESLAAAAHGWGMGLEWARSLVAHASIELQDMHRAEAVLHESLEDDIGQGTVNEAFAHEAWSRYEIVMGRFTKAEEHARRSGEIATEIIKTQNPAMVAWRGLLSIALQAQDKTAEATEVAREDVHYAELWGAGSYLSRGYRALGLLLEGDEAIELLERAVAVAQASPGRLAEAWSLEALGRAYRLAGDKLRARETLTEGLRLAARCGSKQLTDNIRRELVLAGARPRRKEVTGLASLTPGELSVVQLAAEGMTNREIAEAQFVTLKGVEWHLGNAYRKLGVRSRSELPGLLAQHQEELEGTGGGDADPAP